MEDPPGAVLSRPEFGAAVRSALHDLRHPDRLRANPLLRARLVGGNGPDRLRDLIEAGTATLTPESAEVVGRTFLHPTTTQERIAETLHLSFNTYRRRRDRAVDQLTEWLWAREILRPVPQDRVHAGR